MSLPNQFENVKFSLLTVIVTTDMNSYGSSVQEIPVCSHVDSFKHILRNRGKQLNRGNKTDLNRKSTLFLKSKW